MLLIPKQPFEIQTRAAAPSLKRPLNAVMPMSTMADADPSEFCRSSARLSRKLSGAPTYVHLQSAAAVEPPTPQSRSSCAGHRVLPAAKSRRSEAGDIRGGVHPVSCARTPNAPYRQPRTAAATNYFSASTKSSTMRSGPKVSMPWVSSFSTACAMSWLADDCCAMSL